MRKPLLYAGAAAAGYLATRGRRASSTAGPPISGKEALALGGSHADNYTLYRSEAFGSPYSILGGHTYRTGSRPGIQATIRLSRQGQWQWLIEEVGEGHHAVAHLVKHGSEESFHAAAAAIERAMKKLGRSARGRRAHPIYEQTSSLQHTPAFVLVEELLQTPPPRKRRMSAKEPKWESPQERSLRHLYEAKREAQISVSDMAGGSEIPDAVWKQAEREIDRRIARVKKSMGSSARGRRAKTKSHLFRDTAAGKLPGDLLQTGNVSESTLRRWEARGWISDRGERRLAYIVLTQAGYRAS